ncbi:hypothetical protein FJT64_021627 [Amphibalanus amphitrite]|uniref:Uncharacterized protein n=1 Tax=Amphibalanus amphitrite TaxID=1232801 RepID=A0A6A4WNT6_AMPAM|nr:hypothetical protein FJT64_021627 [Amphibalanus amphitrite]
MSVFFPAFNVVIRNWSGAGEFPLLFGLAWSGTYLGSAAAFPLSSTLCQQHQLGGWTAIYYGSAPRRAAPGRPELVELEQRVVESEQKAAEAESKRSTVLIRGVSAASAGQLSGKVARCLQVRQSELSLSHCAAN